MTEQGQQSRSSYFVTLLGIAAFGLLMALHGFASCFALSSLIFMSMHYYPYCDRQLHERCATTAELLSSGYGIRVFYRPLVLNPFIGLWPLVGMLCATNDWRGVFPRWLVPANLFVSIVAQGALGLVSVYYMERDNRAYGQALFCLMLLLECYYFACALLEEKPPSSKLSRRRLLSMVIAGSLVPIIGSQFFEFVVFPLTLHMGDSLTGFLISGFAVPIVSLVAQTLLRLQGYTLTQERFYADLFTDPSSSSGRSTSPQGGTFVRKTSWFATIALAQCLFSCAQRVLNSASKSVIGLTWLSGFLSLLGVVSVAFNDTVAGAKVFRRPSRESKRQSLAVSIVRTGEDFYTNLRWSIPVISRHVIPGRVTSKDISISSNSTSPVVPFDGPRSQQQSFKGATLADQGTANVSGKNKAEEEEATRKVRTIFTIWIYTAYGSLASSFIAIGFSNCAKMMSRAALRISERAQWLGLKDDEGLVSKPESFVYYLQEALLQDALVYEVGRQLSFELLINLSQTLALMCLLQWNKVPVLDAWSSFYHCQRNIVLLALTVILAGSYFVPYSLWYLLQVLSTHSTEGDPA